MIRQQWNFHPAQSPRQIEQYNVEVPDLTTLELKIDPGRHDKTCLAKLAYLALR